jgi:hypothetical protein
MTLSGSSKEKTAKNDRVNWKVLGAVWWKILGAV